MENLSTLIENYVKENRDRRRASRVSQSEIQRVSTSSGGRFDLGKMYTFRYFTVEEPWYDTQPIVLGLGPGPDGNQLGLNLHYMPYLIRKSMLNLIWTSFSATIQQQLKGTNLGKPSNQAPLIGFTWSNLKQAYGQMFNLEHCVKQYRLDRMSEPRILGYESWQVGAVNDENRFHGITIRQAQALYYTKRS